VRDDFGTEREDDHVVDAIHIIFKDCAKMGVAAGTDVGAYPLAYLPGTEGMEFGRSRVATIIDFWNQRGGDDNRVAGVLDGFMRPNWAEIKVVRHVLKTADGGLGSERWFLRTYGKGHDKVRWRRRWSVVNLEGSANQECCNHGWNMGLILHHLSQFLWAEPYSS
jgi:hypothetical protein